MNDVVYRRHLVSSAVVLVAAIYLASGTMAPYGATAQYPKVLEPCHYLVNVDHDQFEAISRMIRGDGSGSWHGSQVLRRLLFPLVALPFVWLAGAMAGGLVATTLIHLTALVIFGGFVRRHAGPSAAAATLWLLATYPGITYWSGLPYSYVLIVPGSLFAMMLLYRIHGSGSLPEVLRACLLLGVIFVGYDPLGPFFGAAAVGILAVQRRWKWLPAGVIAMALPAMLVSVMFMAIEVEVFNTSTAGYGAIVAAYFRPFDAIEEWWPLLAALPRTFASVFLFGNLIFLPLLFVASLLVARKRGVTSLSAPDRALLLAAIAIFVFTNAAPPYYGWQLRGDWIARMYQPVFPAFLMAIARVTADLAGTPSWRRWVAAVALAVVANSSIAFGPVMLNPLAAWAYHHFYVHSPPRALTDNLRRFGRRPLGVCSASHQWDDLPNPETAFNRPAYMYRYPPATP